MFTLSILSPVIPRSKIDKQHIKPVDTLTTNVNEESDDGTKN